MLAKLAARYDVRRLSTEANFRRLARPRFSKEVIIMARIAREMVANAGVNIETLLDMLVRNAAAELTTYYYYTILRVNLIGLEGEGLKEITEDARIEDRNHFEALVPRIYGLGGKLPSSMVDFLQHDGRQGPPHLRPRARHPERGSRA